MGTLEYAETQSFFGGLVFYDGEGSKSSTIEGNV